MSKSLKSHAIVTAIRKLNRVRLEKRNARKIGAAVQTESKTRKRRDTYTSPAYQAPDIFPKVSILIVGYNGAHHLAALSDSILNQSYPDLEVIYVDNASADGSVDKLRALLPSAKIIASPVNTGFAEGNNIAFDHATGDFILLLNNDAKLAADAIEKMVATMLADPEIGAVSPKIRFWEPFVELQFTPPPFSTKWQIQVKKSISGYHKAIETSNQSCLIPESTREVAVQCVSDNGKSKPTSAPTNWTGKIDSVTVTTQAPIKHKLEGKWVINNAGSWVTAMGDAGDWGLGEFDIGQYDEVCTVDAFCGCCVLIRPAALGLKPLFPSAFFAYYEDTDASERIKQNGFKIVYQPNAVAYHKHASTSVEHSPFFQYFTKRNHSAFQAAHFPDVFFSQKHDRLKKWDEQGLLGLKASDVMSQTPYTSSLTLLEDTLAITAQSMNKAIYHRRTAQKKIGIFNEYWTSLGGGELRALHIALALRAHGDVYLISRNNIDIKELCHHFGLSAIGLKLAVIPDFDGKDTADLDIFINTAFCSRIISRAKKSAYLVSFPHTGGDISEMLSYDLLVSNSDFTQRWCENYWPGSTSKMLYPAVNVSNIYPNPDVKECTIVSVGRFFFSGHNKKQAEMVDAFIELRKNPAYANWRLVLIGGCNTAKSSDKDYLQHVREKASGHPVEILVDAPSAVVEDQLDKASIYWHATGVGLTDFFPDQFEHFGMAIVEAMSHGTVPIIHNRGGAPEIVKHGECGYVFDSVDTLVKQTARLIDIKEQSPNEYVRLSLATRKRSEGFALTVHDERLAQLVQDHLI